MKTAHLRLAGAARPLGAFTRLYGNDTYAFLCESLGQAGRSRYSFFGGRPSLIHRSGPSGITIEEPLRDARREDPRDLIESLRATLAACPSFKEVAPFSSGLVGYLGYDVVRRFEALPEAPPDPEGLPDSILMSPTEVIVVDHHEEVTDIVVHAPTESAASARLDILASVLGERLPEAEAPGGPASSTGSVLLSEYTRRPDFEAGVLRLLDHIRAGDIFQAVLSQRFVAPLRATPLDLYGLLRVTNPAPYMYFLKLGRDHAVLGSSPEILVSLDEGRALTRPLAGTRPRGTSPTQDGLNERELLADEKERAEHVMLVDLARNDLGRVCEYGSVRVTRAFEIERHARVMHIVSEVEGRLRAQHDAFDLMRACFPAGTVTGAPKIRAMQLLGELEPVRRGLYGGAIGYFDPAGRMDLCLAIRTLVAHEGRVLLQAGAGVVSDSDPSREYEETRHKAAALVAALEAAEALAEGRL